METKEEKKPYTPPTLVEYGPLRKLTLEEGGGTPFGEQDEEAFGEQDEEVMGGGGEDEQ